MDLMIRTHSVRAGDLCFEVAMCGSGPKFALLLHGFPEHHVSWRYQLQYLASLGYTVWAPNMRGYGNTTRPYHTGAYALPHLLADITHLIQVAGNRKTLLVGHDWGGTLAWYYAALYPQMLTGIAVFNAPHPIVAEQSVTNPRQSGRWWYIPTMLTPGIGDLMLADGGAYACFKRHNIVVDAHTRKAYLDNLRSPGAIRAMTDWYRAYLWPETKWLPEHRAAYWPIRVPVLNFAGGSDLVLDTSMLASLDRFAPDIETYVFPYLHHWSNQEAPHECNHLISNWLARKRIA
ncbi:MAG: alpha/beta hydrolase [Pseudomonadota bacterium]